MAKASDLVHFLIIIVYEFYHSHKYPASVINKYHFSTLQMLLKRQLKLDSGEFLYIAFYLDLNVYQNVLITNFTDIVSFVKLSVEEFNVLSNIQYIFMYHGPNQTSEIHSKPVFIGLTFFTVKPALFSFFCTYIL